MLVLAKVFIGGVIKSGGNDKSKIAAHEAAIIAEIEKGYYTNRQQIIDMIHERYGIKVSLTGISSLLKKRHQEVKMRLSSG